MKTFAKFMMTPLVAVQLLAAPQAAEANGLGTVIGGILGAGAGGAVCDAMGGDRRSVGACAVIGGVMGVAAAQRLSERDRRARNAVYPRIYRAPLYQPIYWEGDRHRGHYEVVRTGYYREEMTSECRQVKSVITTRDAYQQVISEETQTTCYSSVRRTWVEVESHMLVEVPQSQPAYGGGSGGGYVGGGYGGGGGYATINTQGRLLPDRYLEIYLQSLRIRRYTDAQRLSIVRQMSRYLGENQMSITESQLNRVLVTFRSDDYVAYQDAVYGILGNYLVQTARMPAPSYRPAPGTRYHYNYQYERDVQVQW